MGVPNAIGRGRLPEKCAGNGTKKARKKYRRGRKRHRGVGKRPTSVVLLAVRLGMQRVRHVTVLHRPCEDVGRDENAAHEVVEGGGGASVNLGAVESGRLLRRSPSEEEEEAGKTAPQGTWRHSDNEQKRGGGCAAWIPSTPSTEAVAWCACGTTFCGGPCQKARAANGAGSPAANERGEGGASKYSTAFPCRQGDMHFGAIANGSGSCTRACDIACVSPRRGHKTKAVIPIFTSDRMRRRPPLSAQQTLGICRARRWLGEDAAGAGTRRDTGPFTLLPFSFAPSASSRGFRGRRRC